jgi:hypothetical protein
MAEPPPQIDPGGFHLLSDEEFNALPFAQRLEYLKRAIQARRLINRQIERTLFAAPDKSEP